MIYINSEIEEEITTIQDGNPQKAIKTTKRIRNSSEQEEILAGTYKKKKVIFRAYQVIWYILGVTESLLGFRIILKALGANPFSGFTNLIYALSNPLARPFNGILATTVSGASVFEWSTLIAMLVYALAASGIVELIEFIKPVTPKEWNKA